MIRLAPTPTRPKQRSKARQQNKEKMRLSVRLASIKRLHKCGDISDAHLIAAEQFNVLWEFVQCDALKTLEFRHERVDCGHFGKIGISDKKIQARKQLDTIRRALGERVYSIIVVAAGCEGNVSDVRRLLKCRAADASKFMRDALDDLSMIGASRGAGYGIRAEIA